jgi:hypothetical protein
LHSWHILRPVISTVQPSQKGRAHWAQGRVAST